MLAHMTAEQTVDGPLKIDELRQAVRANRVNFPVPVPIFAAQFRPEIQWRIVELYFVRGWSSKDLAQRYGVTCRRIQQALQQWVVLAMSRGYLQEIPPAPLATVPSAPAWTPAYQPLPAMRNLPPVIAPDLAAFPAA